MASWSQAVGGFTSKIATALAFTLFTSPLPFPVSCLHLSCTHTYASTSSLWNNFQKSIHKRSGHTPIEWRLELKLVGLCKRWRSSIWLYLRYRILQITHATKEFALDEGFLFLAHDESFCWLCEGCCKASGVWGFWKSRWWWRHIILIVN